MLKLLPAMPLLALALGDPTPELIRGLSAMNAASLAAEGLPYSGVAPGARFVVYGRALGPVEPVTQENADATGLAGVTVRVTTGGKTVDAWVMSVSAKRIEALLPLTAETGAGRVALTVNGTDLSAPIRVVDKAFGIQDARVKVASPGELAQVRGTGLGRDLTPKGVEVILAGHAIPAGGTARFASGWETVSFDVPEGVTGCSIPMAIRTGGALSNFSTLAVGDCPDNEGSSEDKRIGGLQLSRTESTFQSVDMKIDSGSGWFVKGGYGSAVPASFASCTVQYWIEQDMATPPTVGLDAGRIDVTGPRGSRELEQQSIGAYASALGQMMNLPQPIPGFPGGELYLDPGDYTFAGSGGADVGPFTVQVKVPEPAVWKNRGELGTVDRSKDLKVEWSNATEEQLVMVSGISVTAQRPAASAVFTCYERGDKGALTVPAAILSALPATPAANADSSMLMMGVSTMKPAEFSASGLDHGTADFSQSIMRATKYK